jgi:hypothetical protein
MQRLTQRPTTVEDIGRAKREWKEISDSKAAMKTQFRWGTCVPSHAPTKMSHAWLLTLRFPRVQHLWLALCVCPLPPQGLRRPEAPAAVRGWWQRRAV